MRKHKHILLSNKMFILKLKGNLMTKYWHYPCKNCDQIIPEYAIPYRWINNELVLDKRKITIL